MKIKISFEIEYENVENEMDLKCLLAEIQDYYKNRQEIPQTAIMPWLELSEIEITQME